MDDLCRVGGGRWWYIRLDCGVLVVGLSFLIAIEIDAYSLVNPTKFIFQRFVAMYIFALWLQNAGKKAEVHDAYKPHLIDRTYILLTYHMVTINKQPGAATTLATSTTAFARDTSSCTRTRSLIAVSLATSSRDPVRACARRTDNGRERCRRVFVSNYGELYCYVSLKKKRQKMLS